MIVEEEYSVKIFSDNIKYHQYIYDYGYGDGFGNGSGSILGNGNGDGFLSNSGAGQERSFDGCGYINGEGD